MTYVIGILMYKKMVPDCGVYTIVYTTSLAQGIDPTQTSYTDSRAHLTFFNFIDFIHFNFIQR